MLGPIRKFSTSIYAKIFLVIVAIPFIFWGMGDVFRGGNVNTIAKIGNDKISTQEFIDYVKANADFSIEKLNNKIIEKLLSDIISEKIIALETKKLDIRLSDNSLGKIIKNEKLFKRENKFSRIEYEKFLVKNNVSAVIFEKNISDQLKKEQFINFIGGGIVPSNFLVNLTYDKINQERNIEIINLNDVFKKKFQFSEEQIALYYNQNKEDFKDIYKSIKFIELNPKKLTGSDDFNDLFFKKLDEIDDLIAEGKNLQFVLKQFNLEQASHMSLNKFGKNKNSDTKTVFAEELVKKIFDISDAEPTVLMPHKNNYYIVEVISTENIQKKLTDVNIKKEILSKLKKKEKRKMLSELIAKINKNNFKKNDFDLLAKKESVAIKKVNLSNLNDDKVLKKEIVEQIYTFPEKRVFIVADISLLENYLVYINEIKNESIGQNAKDYDKYLNFAQKKMTSSLYNTYDIFLKNKYEININHKALSRVNNYFR